jgi:hypothetical protein
VAALANTVRGRESQDLSVQIIVTPRQEERIALLLSFILSGHVSWKMLVRGYYFDRGYFARIALGTIKREFLVRDELDENRRLEKIAMVIETLLKTALINGKGKFMLGIAKYMGHNGEVRHLMARLMKKYSGVSVREYETEIRQYLDVNLSVLSAPEVYSFDRNSSD